MHRTFVPPSGNRQAKLAIVAEQPGIHEIQSSPPRPLIGPAGRGFDECLSLTKTPRHELYLTNVIKDLDAPLKHYISINSQGKSAVHPEGMQYIQELSEELRDLNPNCVLALGNVALFALTNRVGITKWHGSVLESTIVSGLKVIPTFHPATFIPPKFNFINKPLICEDLLRAKYESGFPEIRRRERKIIVRPSFNQSVDVLNHCYEVGMRGQTIALDIEVINGEVDCISFGWSDTEAISIPFRDQQGDYFTPDQELEIMLLVAKIVQEPKITKVGANFIFDLQFLFRKYGILPMGILHCTQIAQKIAFPDLRAGLDAVCQMYTDIPYYKQDGKQWMKMQAGSWEQWWNYNGMDSIVPVEASPKQMETLRKQYNIETYERQRKLIEPLIYMSERGIRIDVQGMSEYKEEQENELTKLAEELNDEVGYAINYNSPPQMIRYFYEECRIKPYFNRKTHKMTSDVDALKRIYRQNRKGSNAARLMLDIRSLSKRISTYLNIGKVDKDGRYRSSYKPVGAETGRLSSGETIFGTGGNQQNWPHDLLRFFLFDECYIGYSLDLSQIENRIVAYVGGVIPQIKAFEQGIDLHRLTASIIFGKPYDEISAEDGSSTIGDGRQSERYWGKKGNHATNYNVGYKTFALKNEMGETEAKRILEYIHQGYPQIKGGYHQTVQNMLKKDRTVTNLFDRKRLFLGPIIPSYPNIPKSACDTTYREAYAHLAQSTCADKINEQGMEYIYYNQDLFRPVELLAQVHDSVVFQIPLTIPWIKHAEIISLIKGSLETPLVWHETEFATPCDVAIGLNMGKKSMIEFKSKDVPSNIDEFASLLESTHAKLQEEQV